MALRVEVILRLPYKEIPAGTAISWEKPGTRVTVVWESRLEAGNSCHWGKVSGEKTKKGHMDHYL